MLQGCYKNTDTSSGSNTLNMSLSIYCNVEAEISKMAFPFMARNFCFHKTPLLSFQSVLSTTTVCGLVRKTYIPLFQNFSLSFLINVNKVHSMTVSNKHMRGMGGAESDIPILPSALAD